jgi:hypothetical protein
LTNQKRKEKASTSCVIPQRTKRRREAEAEVEEEKAPVESKKC